MQVPPAGFWFRPVEGEPRKGAVPSGGARGLIVAPPHSAVRGTGGCSFWGTEDVAVAHLLLGGNRRKRKFGQYSSERGKGEFGWHAHLWAFRARGMLIYGHRAPSNCPNLGSKPTRDHNRKLQGRNSACTLGAIFPFPRWAPAPTSPPGLRRSLRRRALRHPFRPVCTVAPASLGERRHPLP